MEIKMYPVVKFSELRAEYGDSAAYFIPYIKTHYGDDCLFPICDETYNNWKSALYSLEKCENTKTSLRKGLEAAIDFADKMRPYGSDTVIITDIY